MSGPAERSSGFGSLANTVPLRAGGELVTAPISTMRKRFVFAVSDGSGYARSGAECPCVYAVNACSENAVQAARRIESVSLC